MEKIPIRHIAAIQKEPELMGSFSIRDIESLLDGNDMVQELHRHDFYYMLVITNGSGSHEIDFQPYEICKNTIFFMRPGQVHRLELKAGSTGYLIQFSTDFYVPRDNAMRTFSKASAVSYRRAEGARFQRLLTVLDQIVHEYENKEEGYTDAIKSAMGILFIVLAREAGNPATHASLHMQEQLEKFMVLLETHIAEHKKVAQYADMLNLSVYQLNAATKATLGKTSLEVINGHIILEARRCLLATSRQVNQVAYRLGYDDASYFIRFFKQHTGQSPEAFRKNFR